MHTHPDRHNITLFQTRSNQYGNTNNYLSKHCGGKIKQILTNLSGNRVTVDSWDSGGSGKMG